MSRLADISKANDHLVYHLIEGKYYKDYYPKKNNIYPRIKHVDEQIWREKELKFKRMK